MMKRPSVKAVWFSDTISERIDFNLVAKTLEIILYVTLERLIGRKSFIV